MVNKNIYKTFILIVCMICMYQGNIYADEAESLQFILTLNPITRENPESSTIKKNIFYETNETALLMALLFRLYKNAVSSQDRPACGFHPSCSEFALLAVKKYGLIRGIIMTADRLLRCNGMDTYKYTVHKETGKLYDPVD